MRLWPRKVKPSAVGSPAGVESFSWAPGRQPWLPDGTYVGTSGGYVNRVTRDEAISVPAVKRGRDLVCSIGALPLLMLDASRQLVPSLFLNEIDPNTANVVTLAQTFDDLVFEGVAWWEITDFLPGGFPKYARHLDVHTVSMTPPAGYPVQTLPSGLYPGGVVWVMGAAVDARNIIRFDSPNDPLLGAAGARAIRRALKLAQTGEMYADDPEAKAFWAPSGDVDPGTAEEIRGYLQAYMSARRNGSEAYIPAALDRKVPAGASAVDIQLAQLQARSDLEIANILGIDPEDIGVNTTSRTYNNATDRRVDRLNMVLAPYMKAVTDRLSLDDVTRPGHRVVFDLDDYLKADPATRWGTYGVAIDKGIMSVGEVREKEELPAVPVEPVRVVEGSGVPGRVVSLSAKPGDLVEVSFSSDSFSADVESRQVSGLVLPYGVYTSDSRSLMFSPGSVSWNKSAVSRVKLDREHDLSQLLGSAVSLRGDGGGVHGVFKVARTGSGDEALSLAADGALDGLSAVVEVLETMPDPADRSGTVVTRARLKRVTLTADPAFSDARVSTVAATATYGRNKDMGEEDKGAAPPAGVDERLTAAVEGFTAAVEKLAAAGVPGEQRRTVPVGLTAVREPLVYSLTGQGHSFVRDAWDSKHGGYSGTVKADAFTRLRKYSEQTAELSARASAREVSLANAGNTTDQADLIPPGYRPELYVGQLPQGRPLFDSMGTRVNLTDATPFKVPYWVGSADLSGTNSEGTGPTTGTITDHDYRTVTPSAQSGEFVITRELMDSANPAIDVIAMRAMREEYAQDTEALIAAHLAAYTDDGAPVMGTSATSTEGCYVYAVTGTGNDLILEGIRFAEGEFPGHRFTTPDRMLASPTGYGALLKAVDDIGRPMLPFLAPGNAVGTAGRAGGSLLVDGLAVPNAWSMTSTYNDVVLFNSADFLVGESPLLTFRFEEKSGPENIVLNLWGYFAAQILRPAGIHSINYTAA